VAKKEGCEEILEERGRTREADSGRSFSFSCLPSLLLFLPSRSLSCPPPFSLARSLPLSISLSLLLSFLLLLHLLILLRRKRDKERGGKGREKREKDLPLNGMTRERREGWREKERGGGRKAGGKRYIPSTDRHDFSRCFTVYIGRRRKGGEKEEEGGVREEGE
jgi:hypothetical protein